MKKFGFLFPVLIFLLFTFVGSRVMATGAVNPTVMIVVSILVIGALLVFRPKTAAPKPMGEIEKKVRGDFAKDAFLDNPQLMSKFQAALKDYSGNMPKACLSKLTKLAPLCTTKEETYAVAMATAMCQTTLNKHGDAIRQYNQAIVLHPTSDLALSLGSCYQRLGELEKAQDSYEFALELDANNVDARSILATTYVAQGDYDTALDQASMVLDRDAKNASALATIAICYGVQGDSTLSKRYAGQAVENGYSEKKISDTISALKKRK